MKYFLLFFFLFPCFAKALKVSANVDKRKVAINESFVFKVKIQSEGGRLSNVYIPALYKLKDFYFLGEGSEQRSSISIINGQRENIKTLFKRYRLQPKKTGTFKIQALAIRIHGQIFKTNPVLITVTNKRKAPSNPSQSSPFALPTPFQIPKSLFDMFTDPFPKENRKKADIKLQLILNKDSVYKMEMIRANWLVFQSSGSIDYKPYEIPSLKGFWKEEVKNKTKSPLSGTQVIDQVLYRKTLLESLWLFPLQTGKLIIDPYSIQVYHLSAFQPQKEIKSFPSRYITVKELPSEGLNDSFTGAVGSFEVKASLKEKSALVNQPVSYKITFKGLGHPRFISLPPLDFPSSVQIYPPAERSYFSDMGEWEKEFEFLIIPKKLGILNIPSFTLSVFDPKTDQYVFHKTPAFSLHVKQGDTDAEEGETFFKKEQEQQKQNFSLEPLKTSYWPQFISYKNLMSFWLILFGILPISLLFLYVKNFALKKEKSLKKEVKQKFEAIQKLLNKKNWQKACAQMILVNYTVLYAAQIKSSSPDWRQTLKKLPPSLNKKYASHFETLFKKLEKLSFGPEPHSKKSALNEAHLLFKHTKKLIKAFLSDL